MQQRIVPLIILVAAVLVTAWVLFPSKEENSPQTAVSSEPGPPTQVNKPVEPEPPSPTATEETTVQSEEIVVEKDTQIVEEVVEAQPVEEQPASTLSGQGSILSEAKVVEDDDITPAEYRDQGPPSGTSNQFSTDFSRHTVSYEDILSGGPPKDGIPALDFPDFVTVDDANAWIGPLEPVVMFQHNGDVRAYPLQILTWHEIVNDTVGGLPVVVTFCPLCYTAIAFEREFDGQELDFGTTGRLRFSNLIMYDRQTETWWQQATGNAIAGRYTGSQLKFLPAVIISWEDFSTRFPEGKVLSRDTGHRRDYGRNPYSGYDNINNRPFLYVGPSTSGELPPMARVLTVELNDQAVAYPYDILQSSSVINHEIGGEPVAVFWETGTASALDSSAIAEGRDDGAASVYLREIDGQVLNFSLADGKIVDLETGTEWNLLGEAINGPLEGSQLEPVVAINHFWFSWAAFMPETIVYAGDS